MYAVIVDEQTIICSFLPLRCFLQPEYLTAYMYAVIIDEQTIICSFLPLRYYPDHSF